MVYFVSLAYEPRLVLMAMFMTAGITIALTMYAIFTKSDFTMIGGGIVVFAMSLFMFGVFALVF
eukprot:NODE_2706_length_877_cov_100.771739_g2233_i0.p2 GENE.NODE_2706_length_877_cov_100.771739_g2233_i0~~NODE_2706_length_877_cov_100.771739_g2233_i0.p2  ORF type:complete len:64 (-),score=9.63 NODE_2706_length_877_cov_100.771739_g2233_i0:225-416(-)